MLQRTISMSKGLIRYLVDKREEVVVAAGFSVFFFPLVRSCDKLGFLYEVTRCVSVERLISPEVRTLLKHFIGFGLIWITGTSLSCTDWMVCPNKSVKRPFTVDLHLQSLLHDTLEAKFLDVNKPWSCKFLIYKWVSPRALWFYIRTRLKC